MKDEMGNTPIRGAFQNDHKRYLPTHAWCERVARERAARMGAILCRVSKTAQVRTKAWCASDRRASIKAASAAARAAGGGTQAARDCKVTADHVHFSRRDRQGGVRGGSRRGLPPRAAARSAAVGEHNGGV